MYSKTGQKVRTISFIAISFSIPTVRIDWANEAKADRYEVLRLIYQGRFLHGNVTLSALHLQQGKLSILLNFYDRIQRKLLFEQVKRL